MAVRDHPPRRDAIEDAARRPRRQPRAFGASDFGAHLAFKRVLGERMPDGASTVHRRAVMARTLPSPRMSATSKCAAKALCSVSASSGSRRGRRAEHFDAADRGDRAAALGVSVAHEGDAENRDGAPLQASIDSSE